jgi:hypothetical protein
LTQFGMTEDGFKHYFETLVIKNNRSVFNWFEVRSNPFEKTSG